MWALLKCVVLPCVRVVLALDVACLLTARSFPPPHSSPTRIAALFAFRWMSDARGVTTRLKSHSHTHTEPSRYIQGLPPHNLPYVPSPSPTAPLSPQHALQASSPHTGGVMRGALSQRSPATPTRATLRELCWRRWLIRAGRYRAG